MTSRNFCRAFASLAAVVATLAFASGASARSMVVNCTASTGPQLQSCLTGAADGWTILLNAGTFYTVNATVPAKGYEVKNAVTIMGANSSGTCSAQAKTIVDGDHVPTDPAGPGHYGPVFTVEHDGVTFLCATVRFGKSGIVVNGNNTLTITNMKFLGNGRDLNAGPDGDGLWAQDAKTVTVTGSTFNGMGRDGIESVTTTGLNGQWLVDRNTFTGIHRSCINLGFNKKSTVGGTAATSGNTCNVSGGAAGTAAIVVATGAVATTNPNTIIRNTVVSTLGCFRLVGDNSVFTSNTCTSYGGDAAYLEGVGIHSTGFTSNQQGGACITSVGAMQVIMTTSCGPSRGGPAVFVGGDGSQVSGLTVAQSLGTCLRAAGDNQIWTGFTDGRLTCGQAISDGSGTTFGLDAEGTSSTFTNISIGNAADGCFLSNQAVQTFSAPMCTGSGGFGFDSEGASVHVSNLTVGGTSGGCLLLNAPTGTATVDGINHCGSELTGDSVSATGQAKVSGLTVDDAAGSCFDFSAGNSSLSGSTGTRCGTGGGGQGINWTGAGTVAISGNTIGQSYDESLKVDVATTGTFTVTGNRFKNALQARCVFVQIVVNLTLTGNQVKGCQGAGIDVRATTNPIVSSNGLLGFESGDSGGPAIRVVCDTTCGGGQVAKNVLTNNGNEADGLLVNNNSPGPGLTIKKNQVFNMSGNGIEVGGSGGNILATNVVVNSSDTDDMFGIWLHSDGNKLSASTVYGGFDNGIEVSGDGNRVYANIQIHDNGEDGIHVAASAANTVLGLDPGGVAAGNVVFSNNGEGIENDGTGTVIANNNSYDNRQDCAGTGTTSPPGTAINPAAAGNTCADGTRFNDPGPINAPVRKHRITR
jgi:Right handed beta helix region